MVALGIYGIVHISKLCLRSASSPALAALAVAVTVVVTIPAGRSRASAIATAAAARARSAFVPFPAPEAVRKFSELVLAADALLLLPLLPLLFGLLVNFNCNSRF